MLPRRALAATLLLCLAGLASAAPIRWIVPIRSTDKYVPQLGRLFRNEVAQAIQEATDWVKRAPEQTGAFHYLAEALRFGGRFDEAGEAVKRSLELAPGDPTSLEIRAKIAFDQKRYDAALADFTEARRLAPAIFRIPLLIGLCHWWKGDLDDATKAFEEGLALDPNQPVFWNVLSACHYLRGRNDKAMETADKAFGGTQRVFVGLEGIRESISGSGFGVRRETGLVDDVFPGSPAAQAGIDAGSHILNVDRQNASRMTAQQILDAVEKGDPGSEVTIRFQAKGERRARTVTVKRVVGTRTEYVEEAGKALAMRALVIRARDRRLNGQKELEKALQTAPKTWFVRLAKATFDLDFRKPPQAVLDELDALDKELTEPNPMNQAWISIQRALALHRLERANEAVEAMLAARASGQIRKDLPPLWEDWNGLLRETDAASWLTRAHSLMEANDPDALSAIRRARVVLVDDAAERKLLLRVFAWAKRTKQRPSNEAIRYSRRAQLLFRDKYFAAAAGEFEKALDACPFDPGLYCNGAFIMAELRRYSEAIRLMNVYLAAAPGAADASTNRNRVIEWELDLERGKGR